MRKVMMVFAGTALVAISLAFAANPPWGGDDTGWLPPVGSAVNKCEVNIGKQSANLLAKIGKCHQLRITGKLASDTAEDQCEQALIATFTAKVKTTGCDACTNLSNIAGTMEGVADSALGAILCGSGTPAGGDDAGNIPSDAPSGPNAKCAVGVSKALGKLYTSLAKCHINRAKGKLTSESAEDACEDAAKAKFETKTKTVGCDPCINLNNIAAAAEGEIDGKNNLPYCQSPSSAFVEKTRGNMESLF